MLRNADTLAGHFLVGGEAVASEFREQALRATVKGWKLAAPVTRILRSLTELGHRYLPLFAQHFLETDLAAWLSAFEWHSKKLPAWLQSHLREKASIAPPGEIPPIAMPRLGPDDPERQIRFPMIDKGAQSLLDRGLLRKEDFAATAGEMQRKSFTVAGDLTQETIGQVRDVLVEQLQEGSTVARFREAVADRIGSSRLGPAHLENVYRTNLQAAYRDGREALLRNPIVSEVFPYQEYVPINDARVRDTHRQLGKLGLDGTGVYRRDDPFWDYFTPPCGFQCRCGVIPLTLEQAAAKGVLEAKEWLQTGRPPLFPEHRLSAIPFPPEPGFGHRVGVLVA